MSSRKLCIILNDNLVKVTIFLTHIRFFLPNLCQKNYTIRKEFIWYFLNIVNFTKSLIQSIFQPYNRFNCIWILSVPEIMGYSKKNMFLNG
jgi:hypothetical protein